MDEFEESLAETFTEEEFEEAVALLAMDITNAIMTLSLDVPPEKEAHHAFLRRLIGMRDALLAEGLGLD